MSNKELLEQLMLAGPVDIQVKPVKEFKNTFPQVSLPTGTKYFTFGVSEVKHCLLCKNCELRIYKAGVDTTYQIFSFENLVQILMNHE